MRPDWRTLELGSGASTAWFAARCAEVISYEDDPSWYEEVRRQLNGMRNAEVRLAPLDRMPELLSEMEPESFDLVVVDCNENEAVDRMDCLRAGRDLVVPGGLLLLDDSDKEPYREQGRALEGWPLTRFVGTKRFPLMAVETSIYRRPSGELATAV
jgi:predicted O-methyltransferase YrrM